MTDQEMYERTFERPSNYYALSQERQWEIDKQLGIIDWQGDTVTPEQQARYWSHYDPETLYVCAHCHQTYGKGWSDEEAEAEYREKFGTDAPTGDDRVVLCDDCHWMIDAWYEAGHDAAR